MTTLIMMDEDYSPAGIKRRLKEEFARHGIDSETEAAERYGRPQQWVSRRMTGETKWSVGELEDFCRVLGLSYVYVATGIRPVMPPPPSQPFHRPQRTGAARRLRPVADVTEDRRLDLVPSGDVDDSWIELSERTGSKARNTPDQGPSKPVGWTYPTDYAAQSAA